jgi:hypothetical protein
VWRAQTQVLLGRLKYALPGWEAAESRRAAARSGHGGGSQLELTRQWAWRRWGALDGDSSWRGAGYGGDVGRVDRQ